MHGVVWSAVCVGTLDGTDWGRLALQNMEVAPQRLQQAGYDTRGKIRSELRHAVAGANNDDANNPHALGGSLGESGGAKKLEFTYT